MTLAGFFRGTSEVEAAGLREHCIAVARRLQKKVKKVIPAEQSLAK